MKKIRNVNTVQVMADMEDEEMDVESMEDIQEEN